MARTLDCERYHTAPAFRCHTCGMERGQSIDIGDRRIPMSARQVGRVAGSDSRHAGERVAVSLWEAEASHGYKTGYQRVPSRFLLVVWSWRDHTWSSRVRVIRYTGRRYERAAQDFASISAELAQPALAA